MIRVTSVDSKQMPYEKEIEIVERKGKGHPDTICDFLAEEVSLSISKYYYENYGYVMHHNVDKALLVGGVANTAYGGGEIVEPIEIYLVGRATKEKNGKKMPIDEISIEAMHKWLKENIKHLDENNHVILNTKIRPGSKDLVGLFERFALKKDIPLANDTSFGVGFYPLDTLEKLVYDVERTLQGSFPFVGEDIKVMGVRRKEKYHITVACALVDKYISSLEDYRDKIKAIEEYLYNKVLNKQENEVSLYINTADDYKSGNVYLTVTGTSAEQGDDGQVGRGNRVNGLITPYRPMTLEAAAGKNPISHVGKIYNFFANDLARAIVEEGYAKECSVFIVSQIGKPITQPQVLDIQLIDGEGEKKIMNLAEHMLEELPSLWEKIVLDRKFKVA